GEGALGPSLLYTASSCARTVHGPHSDSAAHPDHRHEPARAARLLATWWGCRLETVATTFAKLLAGVGLTAGRAPIQGARLVQAHVLAAQTVLDIVVAAVTVGATTVGVRRLVRPLQAIGAARRFAGSNWVLLRCVTDEALDLREGSLKTTAGAG